MACELALTRFFNDANLVSYWRMEGNSNDSKGNHNGSDTNMSYGAGYGRFGQGARFNGSSSKINTSGNIGISGDATFTIAAWIYLKGSTSGAFIATIGPANNTNTCATFMSGYYQHRDLAIIFDGGLTNMVTTNNSIVPYNQWCHVAVTKTAGNPKTTTLFYLNGVNIPVDASVGTTTSPNITDAPVYMGWWDTSGENYFTDQDQDDTAIFSRALSATEVSDLYQGTKSKFTQGKKAGPGIIVKNNDNSLGTDLVAWNKFKVMLDKSFNGGTIFSKEIPSIYILVYGTLNGGYRGGVLALNGDIHFVPFYGVVGQKVSAYGIVSTYPLVYTVNGAYSGGVLAPNGDIHFVPHGARVGQKVSVTGNVSTYSLIYTTSYAYDGGILAPNGDIHFVPYYANRGQKVSVDGVVSTYSLVYTVNGAYSGGVLAPNGDIHFVPYRASVGQKVSVDGVVSTYSLVYTVNGAYSGGVLAPNGDIHFVPYYANRGQKVSVDGTVSTYLLTYTAPYAGGVLAPNGDIHFIPYSASVGQKVSIDGVVSTYSLAFTSTHIYCGGVLTSNGDIHFVPFCNGWAGQKISTFPAIPFSQTVCQSPFFNKF